MFLKMSYFYPRLEILQKWPYILNSLIKMLIWCNCLPLKPPKIDLWPQNHPMGQYFPKLISFSNFSHQNSFLVKLTYKKENLDFWPLLSQKHPKIDIWPPLKLPPWGQTLAKLTSYLNISHKNYFMVVFSCESENLSFYH